MIESDLRHLNRMAHLVNAAKAGKIGLVKLAEELLLRRDALESIDEAWSDELTSYVATIDSAGLASVAQRVAMGDAYRQLITETLEQVEHLIRVASSTHAHELSDEPHPTSGR